MSEAPATLEGLILHIAASINARSLYPPQHPRVSEAVKRVIDDLETLCQEKRQDAITFLLVDQDLVVDQRPLRKGSVYQQHFVAALRRLGIEGLTLAQGLAAPEYLEFITHMASGKAPITSDHVVVGWVKVAASGAEDGTGEGPGASGGEGAGEPLSTDQLAAARDSFLRFRRERQGGLERMDRVVWGLMEALGRSTRAMLPLAPLKEHDEYTFVHSVNVALLTLAQARSLGIQGPMLHTIGLSAMVHDIGKLFIPLGVLNRTGRLEGEDWKVMMSHAELGAWHLSGLETTGPLPILVAFEHHLRYDGRPNYPVLRTTRRPTLASQMAAVADTYDALSTTRPYQTARPRQVALGILRDRAGTFLDPFLVGNFCLLLGEPPPPS